MGQSYNHPGYAAKKDITLSLLAIPFTTSVIATHGPHPNPESLKDLGTQRDVSKLKWGFPKIRGTILGVPLLGIVIFWGLSWGPLILGNYQIIPER